LFAFLPAAVVLAWARPAQSDQDGDGDPRIVPPDAIVDGRDYSEWTVAWGQWALAFPPAVNPVLDQTGVFAALGQSGPVWFLAGNFGGTTVRTIMVPRGKYLLFPLTSTEWDTVPGFPNVLNLPDPLSVEDIRKITAYSVDGSTLTCEIDGRSVRLFRPFRFQSPVYSFNFNPDLAPLFGYPSPYVRTAVSDGYWLMLAPMRPGPHVIHFTANSPHIGFSLDVKYLITITN
jgi:hypothetical protein